MLNEYQINSIVIKHYDLFRLKDRYEIKDLNIFESDKKSIILIEWPKLIADTQNIKSINLTFSYLNDLNNRSVNIKY